MAASARTRNLTWLSSIIGRRQKDDRETDSFFIIEDLLTEEEDGYLPSELDIDDFLSQHPPYHPTTRTHQQSSPIFLSWSMCIMLGAFLGAATFIIYSVLYTGTIMKSIIEANNHTPQHASPLSMPNLQDFLLTKTKWDETNPPKSPCGNTSATAHAAGCRFGAMAFAWYPAACFDLHTESEFLAAEDWKWYAEPEVSYPVDYESRVREADGEPLLSGDEYQRVRTQLPRQELLAGIHDGVYTDAPYWDRFCEFAERKLWRAVAGAVGGDEEKILLDNYNIDSGQRSACLAGRPEEAPVLVMKYLDCIGW